MAEGASSMQEIWVEYTPPDGIPYDTTITLGDLYDVFVEGLIRRYQIYYVDPANLEVDKMHIDTVYSHKTRMGIKITDELGKSAILSATGALLSIGGGSSASPLPSVEFPSSATVRYCAEDNGKPGTKSMEVRSLKNWEYVITTIISLPTPNMITDEFYVIVN